MADAPAQMMNGVDEVAGNTHRVPIDEVMSIFVHKPGFLLARIDQIANALHGALAQGGETLAQAEVLLAIAAGEASDQVGLARACGIDFAQLQAQLLTGFDAAGRTRLIDLLGRVARENRGAAPRWDYETSPTMDAPSLLCRRALQVCHAHFAATVAPLTITLRQFSALIILHLYPGLSQTEYARIYGLDPSTCAVVLKKLTARGLLQAVRSPYDRRKTLYHTTDEGREQAASVQPLADQSEILMHEPLAPDEAAALVPLLQAIVRRHAGQLRYPGCLPWDED